MHVTLSLAKKSRFSRERTKGVRERDLLLSNATFSSRSRFIIHDPDNSDLLRPSFVWTLVANSQRPLALAFNRLSGSSYSRQAESNALDARRSQATAVSTLLPRAPCTLAARIARISPPRDGIDVKSLTHSCRAVPSPSPPLYIDPPSGRLPSVLQAPRARVRACAPRHADTRSSVCIETLRQSLDINRQVRVLLGICSPTRARPFSRRTGKHSRIAIHFAAPGD